MCNNSPGRRRLRRRQGDGALSHGTQSRCWPSWRASVHDGICMLCHTEGASCSCAATARSTLFQRRRHKRMEQRRTSPSTSMSTRCPCVSTRRSRQLEMARPRPWAVAFHQLHVGGALLDRESQDWRFLVLERNHHYVTQLDSWPIHLLPRSRSAPNSWWPSFGAVLTNVTPMFT